MSEPTALRPHVLSVIFRNEPGTLERIIGLFSGRGYSVESLSFAKLNNEVSRMTLECMASAEGKASISQIMEQIIKIVDVTRVRDLSDDPYRSNIEVALVRVNLKGYKRDRALQIAREFEAPIFKGGEPSFITFLYPHVHNKSLESFVERLAECGKVGVARSGLVSLGGRHFDPNDELRK